MYKIPANTLFMGQHLVFVPECHSTNNVLQQLIQQKGLTDGMVVITDNQTEGRGQRGNTWESEPGKNLTLSLALHPKFLLARDQFLLNAFASLAVRDCITRFIPAISVQIKWPNDIMLHGKKTCGILIENQIRDQFIQQAIVGIGLNVNQVSFSFPWATSLAMTAKQFFMLDSVFSALMECLEVRYLQLKSGEKSILCNDYEASLFWKDEVHDFLINEERVSGIILGVGVDGKLNVDFNGEVRSFGFKEITYLG
ncbi:MAG: biotin--[acetyl-CoA-carboxylase] ligase [Cyclobacteriaceae bacterium]|nr:biotin--[acetyl-CoA-carboxylase] ligase [Cyclobacteriaceae bacterium]